MTDEDFDAVITTHLRGTFTCTRAAAIRHARAGRGRPDHLRRLPDRPGRQLRPDQLRRGQGRHRRHGAHLGDGAGPRRDHRQRRRAGRRHRDDRDRPLPRALHRGAEGRRAAAGLRPRRSSASAPPRMSPAWSPSSPPTPPPASPARPSGSAATGSRCGRTRSEVVVAFADGTAGPRTPSPTVWPDDGAPAPADRRPAPLPESPRRRDAASLDLDDLVAIDVHTHVHADTHGHMAAGRRAVAPPPRSTSRATAYDPTVPDIAADYRGEEHGRGHLHASTPRWPPASPRCPTRRSPSRAAEHPDVLIPFGSVDPARGACRHPAGPQAGRVPRGARVQVPPVACRPSSPTTARSTRCTRSCRASASRRCSTPARPASAPGLPGGRGIKLRYSDPMLLDDVAADFPGLTIIMAHPSVPWQDAAISVATHKANAYIDLSGWSPKYFPPQLVRAANGLLRNKVLFGSDYPLLRPERWIADFEQLDIKPEVKPLIMKENAIRALGLAMRNAGLGSWPERRLRISPQRPAIWFEGTTTTHGEFARPRPPRRRGAGGPRGAARRPGRLVRRQPPHRAWRCSTPAGSSARSGCRSTPGSPRPRRSTCSSTPARGSSSTAGSTGGRRTCCATGCPPSGTGSPPRPRWPAARTPSTGSSCSPDAEPVLRDEPVTDDDPCLIMYTSGTTGRPKGAVLTHGNMTWSCINQAFGLDFTPERAHARAGAAVPHRRPQRDGEPDPAARRVPSSSSADSTRPRRSRSSPSSG